MRKIPLSEMKAVRSLGQKKFRDALGLFVVEGEKMVEEALRSGLEVTAVYRIDEVGRETMARMSMLKNPSPALAVVRKPSREDVPAPERGLFLALDSIRDPGNMGTILRTADWFGIDTIFASEDSVEVYNPKAVQASMGAVFRVRVHYCDLGAVCAGVLKAGGRIYGTLLDGENIYKVDLDSGEEHPVLVVTGNESEGISEGVRGCITDALLIPRTREGSESLNAAVATAITLAEFRRGEDAAEKMGIRGPERDIKRDYDERP